MTIELHHTIVPARDKSASAKFLAMIFGLSVDERAGEYFAPVRVNERLTLDFDDEVHRCETHHYAFKVSETEFDAILSRIQAARIPYGASRARYRT